MYAQLGTVSEGTLRTEDLLQAFGRCRSCGGSVEWETAPRDLTALVAVRCHNAGCDLRGTKVQLPTPLKTEGSL